ncbi:hypothetical protein [Brevibacillus agri]|uniref:hypothetical protein n=1 Tax=Brevibacillus agri TaxID=51101 RepID=UPI00399CCBA7
MIEPKFLLVQGFSKNSCKNLALGQIINPDFPQFSLIISRFLAFMHCSASPKYGNRKFWAEGYYVSTVGLNEATVAKYIREQEAHDQAVDKLSVKEYEDPFSRNSSKKK